MVFVAPVTIKKKRHATSFIPYWLNISSPISNSDLDPISTFLTRLLFAQIALVYMTRSYAKAIRTYATLGLASKRC